MGIDLSQTYKIEKVRRCVMIDSTSCEVNKLKYYGRKNDGKICIRYNAEDYMLKFPSINEGIFEHGYLNNNTNTL